LTGYYGLSATLIYFCAYSNKYILCISTKIEVKNMPRGDRTGPSGLGPMTGRAAGYCAGYPVPGFMNPPRGLGRGLGRRRGRGWGRGLGRGWWWAYPPSPMRPPYTDASNPPVIQPPSPKQEIAALKNYQKELEAEKADLEQEMDQIKFRIEEIKAKLEKES
jgi:hypothetical protein